MAPEALAAVLADALRSAREAVLITTPGLDYPDPTIVYANAAAERLTGYAAHELIGRSPRLLQGPATERAVLDQLRAALSRGDGFSGETANYRKGGTPYTVSWRIAPLRDGEGGLRHWVAFLRDVTHERAVQAALAESETRFRTLAEQAPVGIALFEADGSVCYANPRAGAMAGRDARALLGRDWPAVMHPEDLPGILDEFAALLAGTRPVFERTYRVVWPDGRVRRITGRAVPVRDPTGRITGYVGTLDDVTEREYLEAQLRQAQKMEAVGQLAGGVAHDFNNLLSVIGANLRFLEEDLPAGLAADHPVRADLAEIGQAAARAGALVRQLLLFSRRQPIRARSLRLSDVVRGAERLLRRVIGEEIQLVTALDDRAVVRADAGQLEQVIMNLAVNARDAMLTPRDGHLGTGGTVEIAVDVIEIPPSEARAGSGVGPGRWVRLRVSDTGHGMDAETQARAFEPFFTTKSVSEGTGLGLATVFGIVRHAGGAVRVDSTPGRGTTFTILLPATEGDEPPAEGRGTRPAPPAREGATVLLVEDEAAVRTAARRILERGGYTVLEARHGGDALLLWRQHRAAVDVVVTDLRMPELGGRDLAADLRRERGDLPVVFVSGYPDQHAATPAGPREAFVEKPFTGDALLEAVRQVLQQVPGDLTRERPQR